jgi:N utilization substance protein B
MSASATGSRPRPAGGGGAGARGAAQRRSAARLAAVQALYQVELGGAEPDQVIREFVDERLKEEVDGFRLAEADRRLLADLVRGVAAGRAELDDMLAAVLDEDWPVERLETLLLTVLRAGAFELADRREVPVRVVISEYVAVADAFFAGKEPGMVNGVLDRLARALRPEEFEDGRGAPAGSGAA